MNDTAPTRQTATYGDFVTLPSTPGILWRVEDCRALDKAGDPNETRAKLRPYRPGPDPLTPADGAQAYRYDEPVRIGRAERANVEISLRVTRPYDRETDSYGVPQLQAWATTGSYDASLTDAQRATLARDVEDPYALSFILPPLTADEIAAKLTRAVKRGAESAAYEVWKALPDTFNGSQNEDGTPRPGRGVIAATLAPDAETRAATLDALTDAAVAAFAAEVRDTLGRYL